MRRSLGRIVSGSINKGLIALLNKGENIEDYPVGALITIHGSKHSYLGIITDAGIESSDDIVGSISGSGIEEEFRVVAVNAIRDYVSRQKIEIALIGQYCDGVVRNADTTPSFYSDVLETSPEEIKMFFMEEDKKKLWNIGVPKTPKGIQAFVPIDVEKLVELSFGIFGKSGTGKTFLGNILAGYMVLYDMLRALEDPTCKRIRLLIFDMHSEYGLELKDNMGNIIAEGIAKIFSDRFVRFTPDLELAENRGLESLRINYCDLTLGDVALIAPIFGVSTSFLNYLSDFERILRKDVGLGDYWVWGLILDGHAQRRLERSPEGQKILNEIANKTKISDMSILRKRILDKIRAALGVGAELSFRSQTSKLRALLSYPYTSEERAIDIIVDNLISREGQNVVISMGRYEKETPLYMMIANLIARRLRERILEKTMAGEELETKIIIFLEEAHNFLGKETYRVSPFGEIAREMRKKGVMLCVIDQKPSELDRDVISMLWTNFVFTLTDKADVESALIGVPRAELFKKVIPMLGRQEVLIYGEAVRFPVVIRVEDYSKISRIFSEYANRDRENLNQKIDFLRKQGII